MNNNQCSFCPYYMNHTSYVSLNTNLRSTMQKFASFSGIVKRFEDFYPGQYDKNAGCYKLMSLESVDGGPINFVISPETYFVNHELIEIGDSVTGFFNSNAPTILIYPPQYNAIVMAKQVEHENVTVDYFNDELISSNGNLKLNLTKSTPVLLTNDQLFNMYPSNRNLIVIYGPTTKSIPAQTNPYKIIVLC